MRIFTPYYWAGFLFLIVSCTKTNLDNPDVNPTYGLDSLTPGMVFIGSDDGNLYALRADNGTQIWSAGTGGAISTSPYAHTSYFHNGTISSALVVVGSEDGTLYTYNAFTGQAGWTFKTGGPILVDPVIADSAVYVESEDGHLYSLNEQTGQMKWSALIHGGMGPNFIIYQESVFCSSKDGNLYAINKADGSTQWATNPGGGVSSSPVIYLSDDGHFYHISDIAYLGVGSFNGNYYKLNAATGEVITTSQLLNRVVQNAPLVFENSVTYAGDASGSLLYIDEGLNIVSWTEYTITRSSPTVVNRLLYIGDGNGLLYQNKTDFPGQGGLGFQTGGPIESSPVVSDSIVYLGSDDHKVYAVDFTNVNTGYLKWSFETGGKVRSSPCVMDKMGTIYHPYFSGRE